MSFGHCGRIGSPVTVGSLVARGDLRVVGLRGLLGPEILAQLLGDVVVDTGVLVRSQCHLLVQVAE